MHEELIVGKGEQLVDLALKRTSKGLLVKIKTHPLIEEMFKTWSGSGQTTGVSLHGRTWLHSDEEPLEAWQLNQRIEPFMLTGTSMNSGPWGRIDRLGVPIIEQMDGSSIVNIGFLRLVGTSGPSGRSFVIRGVYSTDALQETSKRAMEAIRRLFLDYMRPVELTVVITAKD